MCEELKLFLQLFAETEICPTQQRLTPEEVKKRAMVWRDNIVFAIEHGPAPGGIPTICKKFAYKMNQKSLPAVGW